MKSTFLEQLMRSVAETARIPVIVILLCFLVFSLFSIGMIASEAWTERRHVKYHLSCLLDKLQTEQTQPLPDLIKKSGLLARHRKILLELASHPSFDRELLESLADNLLEKEQLHYDAILSTTSVVARIAPMAETKTHMRQGDRKRTPCRIPCLTGQAQLVKQRLFFLHSPGRSPGCQQVFCPDTLDA